MSTGNPDFQAYICSMNRQQFSELVKDPQALGEETIIELENLLKQYPYCQTAQVLLALNLLQQNHSTYQAQLKKTVAYAGDRKKLKELLEGNKQHPAVVSSIMTPEPVGETLHTDSIPESIPQVVPEEPQAAPVVEITPPLPILNIEPEQDNHIEESVISSDELALASPQSPVQEPEMKGFVAPLPSVRKKSEVSLEKVTQDELLTIVRKRLAEINEEKSGKETKPGADILAEETDRGEPVLRPAAAFNKSKNELIEEFIMEEPQISRPKREFFNPTASSQRSNMDEEDIVSETLALLYARQGNLQKAIHIYEKLSLRFSEKSRYFAAQIENLKGNTTQAS